MILVLLIIDFIPISFQILLLMLLQLGSFFNLKRSFKGISFQESSWDLSPCAQCLSVVFFFQVHYKDKQYEMKFINNLIVHS